MVRSCPGKLAVTAALLLSALVLFAGPALAQGSTGPALAHASIQNNAFAAADPQPARDVPDDRDRRVLAALAFTVIGTIGLITIGSLVLLTQPEDRQVIVVEPADISEESSAAPIPTRGAARNGKEPAAERHVSR
ncbi:MAG: hypothetical protein ACRDYA_05645 [Egibacteraceae bacterium]